MLDICKTINLFIAGGFGVKNNKKTRKFLKMWANLEIGHPQGMKEKVLESVSGSPQLREPSAQGALSSGSPQEFLKKFRLEKQPALAYDGELIIHIFAIFKDFIVLIMVRFTWH